MGAPAGILSNNANHLRARRRRASRRWRTVALYTLAIIREFRLTLLIFGTVVVLGAIVFALNPIDRDGTRPVFARALYGAWMAMLAQPFFDPGPWYVGLIDALWPLFGIVLIGEGIVRFGLLMLSRRHGEKEWMNVMASTYRNHVVLAGLGHLGFRIFEQLHAAGVDVVVLDSNANGRFIPEAKALGAAVLIRDMTEDQSLIDAGIEHARTIIIATNRDMANLEVALNARRMNPKIRVVMRLFDQRIAEKIAGALTVDVAFSSSSLAAPMVAALSLESKVLSTVMIGGVPHVVSELKIADRAAIAEKRIDEIEMGYAVRVLARTPRWRNSQSPPSPATMVKSGDVLIVHTAASQLPTLAAASNGAA